MSGDCYESSIYTRSSVPDYWTASNANSAWTDYDDQCNFSPYQTNFPTNQTPSDPASPFLHDAPPFGRSSTSSACSSRFYEPLVTPSSCDQTFETEIWMDAEARTELGTMVDEGRYWAKSEGELGRELPEWRYDGVGDGWEGWECNSIHPSDTAANYPLRINAAETVYHVPVISDPVYSQDLYVQSLFTPPLEYRSFPVAPHLLPESLLHLSQNSQVSDSSPIVICRPHPLPFALSPAAPGLVNSIARSNRKAKPNVRYGKANRRETDTRIRRPPSIPSHIGVERASSVAVRTSFDQPFSEGEVKSLVRDEMEVTTIKAKANAARELVSLNISSTRMSSEAYSRPTFRSQTCVLCSKRFTRCDSLKRHLILHVSLVVGRSFCCLLC